MTLDEKEKGQHAEIFPPFFLYPLDKNAHFSDEATALAFDYLERTAQRGRALRLVETGAVQDDVTIIQRQAVVLQEVTGVGDILERKDFHKFGCRKLEGKKKLDTFAVEIGVS